MVQARACWRATATMFHRPFLLLEGLWEHKCPKVQQPKHRRPFHQLAEQQSDLGEYGAQGIRRELAARQVHPIPAPCTTTASWNDGEPWTIGVVCAGARRHRAGTCRMWLAATPSWAFSISQASPVAQQAAWQGSVMILLLLAFIISSVRCQPVRNPR